jgi:hypothetical protein
MTMSELNDRQVPSSRVDELYRLEFICVEEKIPRWSGTGSALRYEVTTLQLNNDGYIAVYIYIYRVHVIRNKPNSSLSR